MIKADIIDLVHEKIGFSRHDSAEVVEAALDVLKEALQKGERVQIVGFGSFMVRPKKERVGRNPKTGEEIIIAPRKVLTFKPSKILRDLVNDGGKAQRCEEGVILLLTTDCQSSPIMLTVSVYVGGLEAMVGPTGKKMDSRFPEKLFYRIGDVSEITGIRPHVLRYWESEFSGLHPRKTPTGQRIYERRDVELVLEIKTLLYEQRYTISGAKKLLARRRKQALKKSTSAKMPGDVSEALKVCCRELRGLLALLEHDGPRVRRNGGQAPDSPRRS